jgi:hypothetical protein
MHCAIAFAVPILSAPHTHHPAAFNKQTRFEHKWPIRLVSTGVRRLLEYKNR